MQPSDVDRIAQAIIGGIVNGAMHIAGAVYEWYRNHTAPYYVPPPEMAPNRYDEQPQAVYPELSPIDKIEEE